DRADSTNKECAGGRRSTSSCYSRFRCPLRVRPQAPTRLAERVEREEDGDNRGGAGQIRGPSSGRDRGGERGAAVRVHPGKRPTLSVHSPPAVHRPACDEHRHHHPVVWSRGVRVFRHHALDLRLGFRLPHPLVHLLHVARHLFLNILSW
ncbi:unnamed protein product, partial [Linum tenue]